MKTDMRFPVIEVIDNASGHRRIVGIDSHDVLHLDENSGGIQYFNLQCCESTERIRGKKDTEGFTFAAELQEWSVYPEIRMVSFKELCKIYLAQTQETCDEERKLREFIEEIVREHDKIVERELQPGTMNLSEL